MFENILWWSAQHIAATVFYGQIKKDRRIETMVSGTNPRGTYDDTAAVNPVPRPQLGTLVCLLIVATIFAGVIKAPGGKLFYV